VSAARGAAPVVQPAARLQARAEAMTATQVRQISAESAEALNAAVPVVNGPNPPAAPFSMAGASAADRARSLDCLTAAIYYESATEPVDGQRAVAQVVLNRVRHPAYPNTVCGVVFEGAQRRTGCQSSFACDGALRRTPMPALWERARGIAAEALNGRVYAPVGLALNYHANYVVPYWASSLSKNANVGLHVFYRWRGNQGRPGAFSDRYAGAEPAIAWRGGFGQPLRQEVQTASTTTTVDDRSQAAIEAAEAAIAGRMPPGDPAAHASVDSFQRSVLRRYEPLRQESAAAVIDQSTRSQPPMSSSQRWALTGQSGASTQQPLGRRPATEAPPAELQGVRRRGDPAPAVTAGGNNDSSIR
jgi:spore germination cell wall hydrolase CwlJ-like protein